MLQIKQLRGAKALDNEDEDVPALKNSVNRFLLHVLFNKENTSTLLGLYVFIKNLSVTGVKRAPHTCCVIYPL